MQTDRRVRHRVYSAASAYAAHIFRWYDRAGIGILHHQLAALGVSRAFSQHAHSGSAGSWGRFASSVQASSTSPGARSSRSYPTWPSVSSLNRRPAARSPVDGQVVSQQDRSARFKCGLRLALSRHSSVVIRCLRHRHGD